MGSGVGGEMESFRDTLQREAEKKRDTWRSLAATRRIIENQVEELRRYIDDMNPLLIAEGLTPIDVTDPTARVGFAAPGNRSPDMPARRVEFVHTSLRAAVESVLSRGGAQSIDQIIRSIYEAASPTEIRQAKRSLVSTLAEGARKGWWERVEPGIYQATPPGEKGHHREAGTALELALPGVSTP